MKIGVMWSCGVEIMEGRSMENEALKSPEVMHGAGALKSDWEGKGIDVLLYSGP